MNNVRLHGCWLSSRQLLQLHIPDHGIEREQDMFALFVIEGDDVAEALNHAWVFEDVGVFVLTNEVVDGIL